MANSSDIKQLHMEGSLAGNFWILVHLVDNIGKDNNNTDIPFDCTSWLNASFCLQENSLNVNDDVLMISRYVGGNDFLCDDDGDGKIYLMNDVHGIAILTAFYVYLHSFSLAYLKIGRAHV